MYAKKSPSTRGANNLRINPLALDKRESVKIFLSHSLRFERQKSSCAHCLRLERLNPLALTL